MPTIDLNSDLGESFGQWSMGDDAAMLDIVTSANVACGFHAGDPAGILRTLRAAAAKGVTIGAVVRGQGEQARVLIAHHDTAIEAEDHLILFVANKRLIPRIEKLFQVGVGFF